MLLLFFCFLKNYYIWQYGENLFVISGRNYNRSYGQIWMTAVKICFERSGRNYDLCYLAVWSNSAVRFARLVNEIRPSSFYLFGCPVSAIWASLFETCFKDFAKIYYEMGPVKLSLPCTRG